MLDDGDVMKHEDPGRIDRALQVIEAYGANPARWPERDRVLMNGMRDAPVVADALREAQALDMMLDKDPAPEIDRTLMNRLVAAAPVAAPDANAAADAEPGVFDRLREFLATLHAPQLASAGALALAAVAGYFTAGVSASTAAGYSPEAELASYADQIASEDADLIAGDTL